MTVWLALNSRHGAPANALILSSAIATSCVILNDNKSTAEMFNFMAVLSTSVTLWLYLACAGAALRLGVAMPVAALGLIYAVWTLWGAGLGVSAMSLILMARSEEPTSELQSLMRISYAVFRLKKKHSD